MTTFGRLTYSLMFLGLLVFAAWPVRAQGPQSAPAGVESDWTLCARHVAEAERLLGVPARLLTAISMAESGRHNKEQRAVFAWPWTVMAEGKGRYLPTRTAAVNEVRQLKAKGVRNIDVGCMQINLMYHPQAFDSLEQAFDPAYNVAYSAKYLLDHYRELNSWEAAVGRYHSATPKYNLRYRTKVMDIWNKEQQKMASGNEDTFLPVQQASRPANNGDPSDKSDPSAPASTLPYTAKPISAQSFAHSSQIQPGPGGPFFAR
ncbi:lytic transglycosylase domain-containing protein [Fodinicurvata sediminis]|uniref:lytic transglycosylase domain-containing protein n=1 Tax=Fodinicurvata sediminis TaxID=1121832 RepID=UPI0004034428|nr:lytic transglycosylase domain-containing protein [Fodinicurvata sediminis]